MRRRYCSTMPTVVMRLVVSARCRSAMVASWTLKAGARCASLAVAPSTIVNARAAPSIRAEMPVHFMRGPYHWSDETLDEGRQQPLPDQVHSPVVVAAVRDRDALLESPHLPPQGPRRRYRRIG